MKGFSLHCLDGDLRGQVFPLPKGKTELGRKIEPGIIVADKKVSSLHCVFEVTDGPILCVEDAGSANGTYVNGVMISARMHLRNGDRVIVGTHVFEVRGGNG